MKRSINVILAVLITLSLTAFGIMNWNTSGDGEDIDNFLFDVGPRFGPIAKQELNQRRSFDEFISFHHMMQIVDFKSVEVILLEDGEQTDSRIKNEGILLSQEQLDFLHSLDYSTNVLLRAEYLWKHPDSGQLEDSYSTPYMTIVPEKQAEYAKGNEDFIQYLKDGTQALTENVRQKKLQPGKIYFTVTKEGSVRNVELTSSSGYKDIDEKTIELLTNAQGKWLPAENYKNEKVEQRLVISFGSTGC